MSKNRGLLWNATHVALLTIALLLAGRSHLMAQQLSASAISQIEAIDAEKMARTPEQQKIDSQLLQTTRTLLGVPAPAGFPQMQTAVQFDTSGNALGDIKANVTTRENEPCEGTLLHDEAAVRS